MQDRLCQLEGELKSVEDRNRQPDGPDLNNGSFREDVCEDRVSIIRELEIELLKYNKYLLIYSQTKALPNASSQQLQSLENWTLNYPGAIIAEETEFMTCPEDSMSLVLKAKSPMRKGLERFQMIRMSRVFRSKQGKKCNSLHDPEVIYYYNDKLLEKFANCMVVVIGLLMLIAPLWILYSYTNQRTRLGIISGFIGSFQILVSIVTVARPFEALAATAAYSAVLMVFLQVQGTQASCANPNA